MSDFECLPIGTAARLAELETEVERLRAERDDMQRQRDAARGHGEGASISQLIRERDAYRAEVERLREKLLIACNRGDVADAEVGRLQAEVERLVSDFEVMPVGTQRRLAELENEVERLRDSCAAKADRIDKLGETVERLRALNGELLEALKLALSAHGVMLLSDPPQEAWKAYGVEQRARAAIAKAEGQL